MKQLKELSRQDRAKITTILTDIDDTLTSDGRLHSEAYSALEKLQQAGFRVIPITGRPAGWCDHIVRMWPVDAIVGENGAFYFHYDHNQRKMTHHFMASEEERSLSRKRLDDLAIQILKTIPGAGLASDQAYRIADLAIDFCEDVARLSEQDIDKIVEMFENAGATAKVSSIHVNGWFGTYDKLSMTRILMKKCFDIDLDINKEQFIFSGDSPNDSPMFGFFPNSVGVANVLDFKGQLQFEPAYVTRQRGGAGFAELAELLLP